MQMKRALIVVDYQNDFVTGALGFSKAKEIEQAVVDKIKKYLHKNEDLIFTFDTHGEDYLDTHEGKHLPVPHCLKGTSGWQLCEALTPFLEKAAACFEKPTFGSLELANYLQAQGYDEVELCGVVSHICVISNAVLSKAALPQAKIIIDANCTAGLSDDMHQKALDLMEGLYMTVTNRSN